MTVLIPGRLYKLDTIGDKDDPNKKLFGYYPVDSGERIIVTLPCNELAVAMYVGRDSMENYRLILYKGNIVVVHLSALIEISYDNL